jgi:cytochrome c-type biogenesis protein CcmH
MLWLGFGLMTAVALAAVLLPLLRSRFSTPPARGHDLAIYHAQLAELEGDRAQGLIGSGEAQAAQLEIERRLLRATRDAEARPRAQPARLTRPLAAGLIGLAIVAAAFGIYGSLGSPELPGTPFVERQAPSADATDHAAIEQIITELSGRLAEDPHDARAWLMLGHAQSVLGRAEEALTAFRRAHALAGEDAEATAALAEALVWKAQGIVTPEAEALFEDVRRLDPQVPASLYYLGLAAAQSGDYRTAYGLWHELAAVTPPDAPWLADLRMLLQEAADELGIESAGLPPLPSAPETAAPGLEELGDTEQQAMIRGMVERLAERLKEEPEDSEGWLRLGRSYVVLGELEPARKALAKAARLRPDDARVLSEYADLLVTLSEGTPSEEALGLYRRVLALEPKNPEALWFVAAAEAEAGETEAALGHLETLLGALEPGSQDHALVQAAIEELRAGR